jgi:predicted TIM-barrel fold metal-dependent hydrolase
VHVFGDIERYPLQPDRAYTPGPASLAELLEVHRQLGIERRVIVHPSPYGSDMRCTVDAASEVGDSTRVVAVIDESITDSQLRALHESGTRGVRINLNTHGIFDPAVAARQILWTQDRIRPYGWHLQLFAGVGVVVRIAPELERLTVPLVLDHWGKIDASKGLNDPEFRALTGLLDKHRIWIKLSAPERISTRPDFDDVEPILREYARRAPERLVWGTDWPHTAMLRSSTDRTQMEPYRPVDDGAALNRLDAWLADPHLYQAILSENPARLYGFTR